LTPSSSRLLPPRSLRALPVAIFLLAGLILPLARLHAVPTPAEEIVVRGKKKVLYHIPKLQTPVKLDGVLDDEAWSHALTVDVNIEIDPGRNTPAPVTTVAYLAYDDDHLYAAFRANDPDPASIRAHLTDRDTAYRDDFVGIFLDTFDDERGGYELFVNPFGVQMDLAINETATGSDDREDDAWDTIWSSVGKIDAQGYVVEMAIPFSSLRFQRSEGEQSWGLGAFRSYPRSLRHQILSLPIDPDDGCMLCQVPKVTGFAGATPGRNVELDPTVTAHRTDLRQDFPSGPLRNGGYETDPGLTARWGITPNLTFAGAVNPDFSQVEADAFQLDLTSTFALFFPEKRPFFLEGGDYFDTSFPAVYTRNVADPSWGTKLTGKQGGNGIGVFVAQDDVTNLILPGSQFSNTATLDEKTTDAVLRYRRDIGARGNLGALVTHREGGGYRSSLYGLDGMWQPNARDKVNFQALRSQTEYPAAFAAGAGLDDLNPEGSAFRVNYNHGSRYWNWYGRYDRLDRGFRADLGFMPQVGYSNKLAGLEHTSWGDDHKWKRLTKLNFGGDWDQTVEAGGTELEEEYEAWLNFSGPLQSQLNLDGGWRDKYWNGVVFNQKFANIYTEFRPTGELYLALYSKLGDVIDFANTRPAKQVRLDPVVSYILGRHLKMTLSESFQRLTEEGDWLIDARISELRTVYQIDLRTFVRLILQYEDVRQNQALFPDPIEPQSKHLFSQLLFSYKLNPQTVLFLGYSDNHVGGDTGQLGERPIDLTRTDRTLFFKVGYALVL
jgi:hypothetical protein